MDEKISVIRAWLGSGSINLFGRPFAGKDTQGKILAEALNGSLISGGDVLRHNHDNPKIQEIMAAGGIIPSELFEEILVPYLSREEFAGRPFILSEVGRMRGEDDVIIRATKAAGHETKVVVFLNLSEQAVWDRFEASQASHDRGVRADDNRDVLQTRLNKYEEMVIPVINHYRELGLLIELDGNLSREEVTESIVDALYARTLG